MVDKFAVVRCNRPSLASAEGEIVAALAVHMLEAEYAAFSSPGAVFEAASMI
jgi:hypothetical protein